MMYGLKIFAYAVAAGENTVGWTDCSMRMMFVLKRTNSFRRLIYISNYNLNFNQLANFIKLQSNLILSTILVFHSISTPQASSNLSNPHKPS
jgi:hypothetical protein